MLFSMKMFLDQKAPNPAYDPPENLRVKAMPVMRIKEEMNVGAFCADELQGKRTFQEETMTRRLIKP